MHEWGSEGHKIKKHESPGVGAKQEMDTTTGSFCLNCNAWRGSLGLEPTPELFIEHCRIYAKECWRVLRDDGTMWVNIGASYASGGERQTGRNDGDRINKDGFSGSLNYGSAGGRSVIHSQSDNYKPKDLIPTPWLFAIALQQDGWYLRSDIIWQKPNPMPESVTDRPTRSHEYVFLFSKSRKYFYDADAVRENAKYGRRDWSDTESNLASATMAKDKRSNHGVRSKASVTGSNPSAGRNLRSVWTIPTHGFSEAHFATFPPKLIEPMIKAGTSEGGVCVECGSQFERVSDRIPSNWQERKGNGAGLGVSMLQGHRQKHGKGMSHDLDPVSLTTLGFRPTCTHYDHLEHDRTNDNWIAPLNWPTSKAIVLDPFGGAGTTQLVATRLGRLGISVELSFEYCKMGRDRTANDIPPMIELIERVREPNQLEMFE